MSADAESFLLDPHGPVNTGTGHQFNNVTFILDLAERLVRVGRDPRIVAREYLRWLHQRFREPRPYGQAQELLADSGSVLLTGAPGSGRRATAQMLLYRLSDTEDQIRELPDADTGGPSDGPMLDTHAVAAGERLLLDLSTSEETYCAVLLGQLPFYRAVVQERGAHMVVVLPRSPKHNLGSEFGPSAVVDIVRPEGKEVFQWHLRSDGIKPTSAQLDVAELTTLLQSEPMQHIADLAWRVQSIKKSEPRLTFPHWLREALAALTERSDEVAKQMTELRSGQQRALLLATAMFSGAHVDAVFEATSTLCTIVQHPEDERPRLEQEGVAEQLAEIKAKANDAGRVRFRLLAYEQAVRNHFWSDFPTLRVGFRDWVGTAIGQRTLTPEDRNEVVIRFAEQALRTGRPEDLRFLVEQWAKRTDARWPSRLLPQAARVVAHGLNDERYGIFFRNQLYNWSRDSHLSSDLAQVVVQVCSVVLALTHPGQAVVRLHHIVRRHSGVAGVAARAALLNFVEHDRRLYRRLLDRVTNGPGAKDNGPGVKGYEAADLALFLDLTDPVYITDSQQPLIKDEAVRDQLVTGWNAVLSGPLSLRCAERVRSWLACEDHRDRELLLDVLVDAGDGRGDLLGRPYLIACAWAQAPGDRQAERTGVADRLISKIDSALGIDFAELDRGDRTEGTAP